MAYVVTAKWTARQGEEHGLVEAIPLLESRERSFYSTIDG